MGDHIKRFPMVLSFNKNKWLQCSLCQKHYCNDLICTLKHDGEHEHRYFCPVSVIMKVFDVHGRTTRTKMHTFLLEKLTLNFNNVLRGISVWLILSITALQVNHS